MSAQASEMHSDEAAAAITDELIACTLGYRQRPELYVGLPAVVETLRQFAETALAAFRTIARSLHEEDAA